MAPEEQAKTHGLRHPGREAETSGAKRANEPVQDREHSDRDQDPGPEDASEGREPDGLDRGPARRLAERPQGPLGRLAGPRQGIHVELVGGVRRLHPHGERGRRVVDDERRVARLHEGPIDLARTGDPKRAHRRLLKPGEPGPIAEGQGRLGTGGAFERRANQPGRARRVGSRLARAHPRDRLDDGGAARKAHTPEAQRRHQVAALRAERIQIGPRSRECVRAPGIAAVERREDQGPGARVVARAHARQLDQKAGTTVRVVGAGGIGEGVVVGRDQQELPARRPQDAHHVRPVLPPALELLDLHLAEADVPELGGDVLGGGSRPWRPERMRPERGQGGGMAEGGVAVDRGGHGEQGGGEEHRRARL